MSPNRIVAVLTPLVFAPLAGVIATWAAENLPGVTIPRESIEEIFIAGALIALAPAAQWLYGWQKHEQQEAEERRAVAVAAAAGAAGAAAVAEEAPLEGLDDELAEIDELDDLDDFDEFEDTSIAEGEPTVPAGG
jgi:hypothetical protein